MTFVYECVLHSEDEAMVRSNDSILTGEVKAGPLMIPKTARILSKA